MSMFKMLVYGALGYMAYQMFFAELHEAQQLAGDDSENPHQDDQDHHEEHEDRDEAHMSSTSATE